MREPARDPAATVRAAFETTASNYARLAEMSETVAEVAGFVIERLRRGGTLMLCGNGGSAADAQHIAAELVGRFQAERQPMRAVALGQNISTATAVTNDYAFDEVFARELRAFAGPDDVLIGITTSGSSPNVIKALESARALGAGTIGLTGRREGALPALCDHVIQAPADETARVQELHIGIGHALCQLIEAELGRASR
ncbi:D-sedoheptulose-7-phosphate isomerase [Rhodovibrio salinarum]|uniref:SIS domain-containing protein n=1 Tax=Rhodovibrio salinarum TaxID=1087 RepID=A0A934QLB1_9PROT|nr:SIS domain-containing protein [Rhodovibrio salinarum]MBK1699021.1 SIS domain-containing protein [Rhodovibrio salinarum]